MICIYSFSLILVVLIFNGTLVIHRATASLPGFTVLPLRQFGSWGPEVNTKFDPQKDTYVLVNTLFLPKHVILITRFLQNLK
jgi:hypothetical protein